MNIFVFLALDQGSEIAIFWILFDCLGRLFVDHFVWTDRRRILGDLGRGEKGGAGVGQWCGWLGQVAYFGGDGSDGGSARPGKVLLELLRTGEMDWERERGKDAAEERETESARHAKEFRELRGANKSKQTQPKASKGKPRQATANKGKQRQATVGKGNQKQEKVKSKASKSKQRQARASTGMQREATASKRKQASGQFLDVSLDIFVFVFLVGASVLYLGLGKE